MSNVLTSPGITMMSNLLGAQSSGLAAFIVAYNKSPALAGLSDSFANKTGEAMSVGLPSSGTVSSSNGQTINIDPSMVPNLGANQTNWNSFFDTLAHEWGHDTLNGLYAPVTATILDGPLAIEAQANTAQVNAEGVATTAEFVVAVQLQVTMHSGSWVQAAIAAAIGSTDVSTLSFSTPAGMALASLGSPAVTAGGNAYSSLPPSNALKLTYTQYADDWNIIEKYTNVDPSSVDWQNMTPANIAVLTVDGYSTVVMEALPLKKTTLTPYLPDPTGLTLPGMVPPFPSIEAAPGSEAAPPAAVAVDPVNRLRRALARLTSP